MLREKRASVVDWPARRSIYPAFHTETRISLIRLGWDARSIFPACTRFHFHSAKRWPTYMARTGQEVAQKRGEHEMSSEEDGEPLTKRAKLNPTGELRPAKLTECWS